MLLVGASAAVVACGPEASTPGADAMADADVSQPDVTQPDAMVTDAARPDVTQPDAMVTDAARPDVAMVDAAGPDASVVDAAGPDGAMDVVSVDTPPADVVAPCTPPAGAVRVGAISSFPVGRWVSIATKRPGLILGRDARGIFAYSNQCTHMLCVVPEPTSAAANSRCPCHGSTFSSEGALVGGPAARPLDNYAVIVCEGVVYVDRTRVVPMGTRTPVA
jgi:Rieske Fe-S protein